MGVVTTPAVGGDGTVFVGTQDGKLYAISPPESGTSAVAKWSFQTGDKVHSSPTIGADGTVYVGSDDGYVYAIE